MIPQKNDAAVAELARALADVFYQQAAAHHTYRHLADAMPHIVWMAEPCGTVTHYNRHFYDYAGRDDAMCWDLMHPDDKPCVEKAWMQAVRCDADRYEFRVRMRDRDGEYRWHHESAVPVRCAEGRVLAWMGQSIDISGLKSAPEPQRKAE